MSTAYRATCDCGWAGGPYKSQPMAERAQRLHSCDGFRAKAEARARGAARKAAVDRTPTPCKHKQTTHQHGTHACYVLDRCRCRPCARANTAYERARSRRHAYGRFGNDWVDATPAREHVQELAAAGMGLKRIVELSGYSQGAMTKLMYGSEGRPPTKRIRKANADNILAIRATVDTLAGGARVDGTGTRRRLQALMTLGWSQMQLAHRLGYEVRNFSYLLHGRRDVTATNARRVIALYDELWDTPPRPANRWEKGGVSRAKNYARTHGFHPPMAWDDDSIDDPTATPGGMPEVGQSRHGTGVVNADSLADLASWGYTTAQAADRLGVNKSSIEHGITRHAPHLREAFSRNATAQKEHVA